MEKGGNRYRWLVQLGINKYMAWEWSNSRKSYARVARSFIMYRAVNNAVLKKRDLVFLLDHYQKVHI